VPVIVTGVRPSNLRKRRLPLREANGFHLALTEGDYETLEHVLFEEPETQKEWERGAICVITRSSGHERASYLVHDVLEPGEGDIEYGGSVSFNEDYRYKAVQAARDLGDDAGILYVHTHPNLTGDGEAWPSPSTGDLKTAEHDLFQDAKRLGDQAPVGIAIVKETSRKWRVLGYEFDTPSTADQVGEPAYSEASVRTYDADCIRVIGSGLTEYPTREETTGVEGAAAAVATDEQNSQLQIWGPDGQEQLNALRVGLVGAGGGGSILAEHLARMGIGELVIIDYDRLEPANLNRAQGATQADVDARRPKVDIAERLARLGGTAPNFTVDAYQASVVENRGEYGAVDRLLDCDIIVHAAEGAWVGQVLDEIAHGHLIPVISGGSNLHNEDGVLTEHAYAQTFISAPGHGCQRCARHWRTEEAEEDMEPSDGTGAADYGLNGGDGYTEDREPSTNSVNLMVAGMVCLRLQDHVLGIASHRTGEYRFLPGVWETKNGISDCKTGCPISSREATGDTTALTISSDPEFAAQRRE
jgi:hypothetical protein